MKWGELLSFYISTTDNRVKELKTIVQNAYKSQDKELVEIIKPHLKDEERWLKKLTAEKTAYNLGTFPKREN